MGGCLGSSPNLVSSLAHFLSSHPPSVPLPLSSPSFPLFLSPCLSPSLSLSLSLSLPLSLSPSLSPSLHPHPPLPLDFSSSDLSRPLPPAHTPRCSRLHLAASFARIECSTTVSSSLKFAPRRAHHATNPFEHLGLEGVTARWSFGLSSRFAELGCYFPSGDMALVAAGHAAHRVPAFPRLGEKRRRDRTGHTTQVTAESCTLKS